MSTHELSCFALTALLQIGTFAAMILRGEKSLRTIGESDVQPVSGSMDSDIESLRALAQINLTPVPYKKAA